MIYFFHHYELPAILQQAQIQQLLTQTQHQAAGNDGANGNQAPPEGAQANANQEANDPNAGSVVTDENGAESSSARSVESDNILNGDVVNQINAENTDHNIDSPDVSLGQDGSPTVAPPDENHSLPASVISARSTIQDMVLRFRRNININSDSTNNHSDSNQEAPENSTNQENSLNGALNTDTRNNSNNENEGIITGTPV